MILIDLFIGIILAVWLVPYLYVFALAIWAIIQALFYSFWGWILLVALIVVTHQYLLAGLIAGVILYRRVTYKAR